MKPARARLFILFAALLWSTGGAAVKVSGLTALQIAGGRALVAGLVMGLILPSARRGFRRPVLLAGAFHAANCILFVYANQHTTAGNVIFIQNIAPVWVLLLGPLLTNERPGRAELISVPISLLGCALLFFDDPTPGRMIGNLAALAASGLFALLIISYRRLSAEEGIAAVTAGNAMIVLACLPAAALGPRPTWTDGLAILHLGALQQAAGHYLFIRGMTGVSALEGSLLTLLEPIASPLWAWLLVDEQPGMWFAAGAAVVIAAQVWRATQPTRAAPPKKETQLAP